jgi:arylsulfatase A-like enzyme
MDITWVSTVCSLERLVVTVGVAEMQVWPHGWHNADWFDVSETDIHIPLIVRGPGIPENQVIDVVTSHTDLAPTFLAIANSSREGLDGKAIPTTVAAGKLHKKKEHVAIEFWGTVGYSNKIINRGYLTNHCLYG